jgi:hypothetical protein
VAAVVTKHAGSTCENVMHTSEKHLVLFALMHLVVEHFKKLKMQNRLLPHVTSTKPKRFQKIEEEEEEEEEENSRKEEAVVKRV